jgi:hypothetical protein
MVLMPVLFLTFNSALYILISLLIGVASPASSSSILNSLFIEE